MLDPRRYGCETRKLAGRFVNHEDDFAPERLAALGSSSGGLKWRMALPSKLYT